MSMMKIGDKAYVKRRRYGGYWIGNITNIDNGVATIRGIDYTNPLTDRGYGMSDAFGVIKKIKIKDLFYKQWAYWEI